MSPAPWAIANARALQSTSAFLSACTRLPIGGLVQRLAVEIFEAALSHEVMVLFSTRFFWAPALRGLWQSSLRRRPVHDRRRREPDADDCCAGASPGRFDPRYDGEGRDLRFVTSRAGSVRCERIGPETKEKARQNCLAFFVCETTYRIGSIESPSMHFRLVFFGTYVLNENRRGGWAPINFPLFDSIWGIGFG